MIIYYNLYKVCGFKCSLGVDDSNCRTSLTWHQLLSSMSLPYSDYWRSFNKTSQTKRTSQLIIHIILYYNIILYEGDEITLPKPRWRLNRSAFRYAVDWVPNWKNIKVLWINIYISIFWKYFFVMIIPL